MEVLPPEQRIAESWYSGTADAIYQNIFRIEREQSRDTLILAGDHIYKMNYAAMIAEHRRRDADLTIACLPVRRLEARDFGVMHIDDQQRVVGFQEKPEDPESMPGHPELALASMGIYIFKTKLMFDLLLGDAQRAGSRHDFGKDIIPPMLSKDRVFAYPFRDENRKEAAYWRDVGTLDAYYQANMDLIQIDPFLNLYDPSWPIHTFQPSLPPPKFVHSVGNRVGAAFDSIVCNGSILSGGQAYRSLLSPAHGSTASQWWKIRSSWKGSRSAGTPEFATPSWTSTSASLPAWRSASIQTSTAPEGSPSPKGASPSSPRVKTWNASPTLRAS